MLRMAGRPGPEPARRARRRRNGPADGRPLPGHLARNTVAGLGNPRGLLVSSRSATAVQRRSTSLARPPRHLPVDGPYRVPISYLPVIDTDG